MLEQEAPQKDLLRDLISSEVDYLAPKFGTVYDYELAIDPDETIYMFTWSPHSIEGPDADFNTQHLFWLPTIIDFLKCTQLGIACVEANSAGNPHYHGWYQLSTDPLKEKVRIEHIKVMNRFAPKGVKITKSRGHYKVGSYIPAVNCLYYYKKDMLQAMAWIQFNPITKDTPHPTLDWSQHGSLFTVPGRSTIAELEDRICLRDFYKQFYNDSL